MFPTWLEHETKEIGKSHDNLPVIVLQSSSSSPSSSLSSILILKVSLLIAQVPSDCENTLILSCAAPRPPLIDTNIPPQKRQITQFVCLGDSTVQVWLCDTAVHKYNNGFSNEVADTKTPHSVNRFHDFATSQKGNWRGVVSNVWWD